MQIDLLHGKNKDMIKFYLVYLISKARPSLKSRVLPTTRLIKNVSKTDDTIYVSNAFPVFNAIDKLLQSERNIQIFDDTEVLPASLLLLFLHHLVYHH